MKILSSSIKSAMKMKIDHRKSSINSKLRCIRKAVFNLDFEGVYPPKLSYVVESCVRYVFSEINFIDERSIDFGKFCDACQVVLFNYSGTGRAKLIFVMPSKMLEELLMPVMLVEYQCAKEAKARLQAARAAVVKKRKANFNSQYRGHMIEVRRDYPSGFYARTVGGGGIRRGVQVSLPRGFLNREGYYRAEQLTPLTVGGDLVRYRAVGGIISAGLSPA